MVVTEILKVKGLSSLRIIKKTRDAINRGKRIILLVYTLGTICNFSFKVFFLICTFVIMY